MRILFLSTNRFRIEILQPMPIGLASIIGNIDESAHAIEVVDLLFCDEPVAELTAALERFRPEVIAVSVRNIDNQSQTATQYFLPEVKQLIELCRSISPAKIIVGGAAFTSVPRALFEYLEPDFGIAGEGEIAFPQLIECIENQVDCSAVPGLVWREDGEVRANAPAFVDDWSRVRPPRRDLFDLQKYAEAGGGANVVVSQGCPMRCLYCDDPYRLGTKQRRKAVEQVVDELESVSNDAPNAPIFFTAPIFNSPPSNAKNICRAIIERGVKIQWSAMLHPAFLDDELADLMHRAGCAAVSLACDSCSERMLESLHKDITVEQLETAIATLERNEIHYFLTILVGGPGEDRETIDETLDFLSRHKPLMVSFAVGIRILPNTAMAKFAVEQHLVSGDDPLMEPKFYVSPDIEGWARGYLEQECGKRDNWSFSMLEAPGAADAAELARS